MANEIYYLNGHYVGTENPNLSYTQWLLSIDSLEDIEDSSRRLPAFCTECGSPSIDVCKYCRIEISPTGNRPGYCGNCGKPFPWTVTGLVAAEDYANELDSLTPDEKIQLILTFDHLIKDTPRSPVEANRFKRLIAKIGPQGGAAITRMIFDLATDAAKKHLGL